MIYPLIADKLRLRLSAENYHIGSPLPGEKKLAEEYAVSRMTIRKAIDVLIDQGLVMRKHGSGTYVVQNGLYPQATPLIGLYQAMENQGRKVISQVLVFTVMRAPPSIARQLHIQTDEQIYYVRRLRNIAEKSIALEDDYMPVKLYRNLTIAHLESSIFHYIENECGMNILERYESLSPVLADKTTASLMHIKENTPLLRITSLSCSDRGEFLSYTITFRNTCDYPLDYRLCRMNTANLSPKTPLPVTAA